MTSNFVQGYVSDDRSVEMEHRDGVPWHDAPVPRRIHRCRPQTRGFVNYFSYVERCACGAIRIDNFRTWRDRNSRKRYLRQAKAT